MSARFFLQASDHVIYCWPPLHSKIILTIKQDITVLSQSQAVILNLTITLT